MTIQLRNAAPEDYDFVRSVHHRTMQGYVKDFFGSWDQDYQNQRFARTYKIEEVWIIVGGGTDVGWLARRESEENLFLTEFMSPPNIRIRASAPRSYATSSPRPGARTSP